MEISVHGLGKRFNREWIFRNLTLTFEPGNPHAITGPNGSGKSTLLQILWGQMPQTTGSINWHQNLKTLSAETIYQHIAVAAPYMDLIEEFTLKEHLEFHFRLKKVYGNLDLHEVLEAISLAHARDKFVGNFSSGMKQRLKLGLAFFTQADVLFLDEPGTNLDRLAFDWYLDMLNQSPSERLIIIASNQPAEYPPNARRINLAEFK